MELYLWEQMLRILLAVVLGSIIGLEREYTQHSAGLRTHILVCVGATIFTLVSISNMHSEANDIFGLGVAHVSHHLPFNISYDPTRIAAQIVSGIGFVGGGAVMRYGATVRGLTTAATLWLMASIGMMIGAGFYILSIFATVVCFLVLFLLGKLNKAMAYKHLKTYNRLRLLISVNAIHTAEIQTWTEKMFGRDILEVKQTTNQENDITNLTYVMDIQSHKVDVNEISRKLNNLTGIVSSGLRVYYHDIGSG